MSVSSLHSGFFSEIVVVGGGIAGATTGARFRDQLRQDPNLETLAVVTDLGPDRAPAWVFDETIRVILLNFRSGGSHLTQEILVA